MGVVQKLIRVFLFSFIFSGIIYGQDQKERKVHFRINAGPVLGFYKINSRHASKPTPAFSWFLSTKLEIDLDKQGGILTGFSYQRNAFSFNSYFFAPGHSFLYDDNLNYRYGIIAHEIQLPVLIKYNLGLEARRTVTGYLLCGPVARYIPSSLLDVSSNSTGAQLYYGDLPWRFTNSMGVKNLSAALQLGLGGQRNFHISHTALFSELGFLVPLSRSMIVRDFTPGNLWINYSVLQISLGFRF